MSFTDTQPRTRSGSSPDLLQGLNEAQQRAVVSPDLPLCILAGAGSGKTRVLTRRIAHRIAEGSAAPQHTLAITFTRKAAGELTKRLSALGVRDRVATGTFHSVAYNQLRQYWTEKGISAPTLTQSKLRILMPLVAQRGSTGPGAALQPADLASEIEWAKARLIRPENYLAEATRQGRQPPLGAEAMAELYRRYEADKRKRGIVDFDDLLMLTAEAMEADREFAARQRWRFRHLFVDEFQDVNPAQARLLDGWLGLLDNPMVLSASTPYGSDPNEFDADGSSSSNHQGFAAITDNVDLCVVGDPNQSIYAWNGADPRFLSSFRRRFPQGGLVRLEDNYRSSPQILTVADAVLGLGARESRALRPNRSDGALPVIASYASDLEEARGIARLAREHHNARTPWKHMAVLTRTNAQLALFEEAFRAAGIPHRVRGGQAFLQQPEVLRTLSMLNDGPARIPLVSRLNDLEDLVAELREQHNAQAGLSGDGASLPEAVTDRIDQIEGVIRMAHEYLGIESGGTVATFLAWLHGAITSANDEPQRQSDVVELATFHRAKGLEWPVVFVAGMERGYVPIGNADSPEGRAEEQRLLYVAVTRAESFLHCSWAKSRTFGSRTTARSASYWLENIEAAIRSLAPDNTADWQTILRDMKDRVAAARAAGVPGVSGTKKAAIEIGSQADPQLYQRLKAWRLAESRHTGIPAMTVMHDTSLAAIAEARPANEAQLLAVPGIGSVKAERYGAALLAVVREATPPTVSAQLGGDGTVRRPA
jgi:DNA helicase II / ATP-dependent DNA helicase PcrA